MTTTPTPSDWDQLREHIAALETLEGISSTLAWDEQTMMPPKAAPLRGRQSALLAGLAHARVTDARIPTWLSAIDAGDPVRAACQRNLRRVHERETKVPAELVDQLARAKSEGFAAWLEAKQASRFSTFEPTLTRLLELSLRRAEAIDASRHPYEVLLEEYDPGTRVEDLRAMFARLREGLVELMDAIADKPALPAFDVRFDAAAQGALHREIAAALGYDFAAGRLDHAEHPFTSGQGPGDVRITTHIDEADFLNGLGSTIHEAGHALYEQGLPHDHVGTTVNEAASFGLHESQSRLWENFIGRSRPFCDWLAARIATHFPDTPVTGEALYQGSNRVERGLIRVAADEVTYNLHVIVRFEIELALFERRLAVKDLPEAWNAKYQELLGLTPPSDALGVLQDVHWSGAAFGYFPSYTLGNLYAASLGATLERELPALWSQVGEGNFAEVLAFLRRTVHSRGHLLEAPEIIGDAVGERDHVEDLLAHLWGRHGALYGVTRPT